MLIAAAAAATFSAWIAAHVTVQASNPAPWATALSDALVLLSAAAGAVAGRSLAGPMQPVPIRFDGAAWAAHGVAGDLQIMLDLGPSLLLLRLRPAGGGRARWLALCGARGGGASDLHALRIALYSRPPAATTPASTATSAVRAPDRATD